MANIKPSEISSILQMQLQNMSNKVQFEEIGKVLQVSDGVAHVYGLDKVQSNELVEFENGTMGVVLNLEEDNVGVVLLGPTEGLKEGETGKRTQRIAYARQIAMYLSEQLTDNSHVQIGRQIGNRNHATVLHAMKQIHDMIEVDDHVRDDVEEIKMKLKQS